MRFLLSASSAAWAADSIEHIAVQHHVGTVGLGGIDLQRRGDLRHADGGLCTTFAGRIGHALRMVAREVVTMPRASCSSPGDAILLYAPANLERSW